MPHDPHPLLRPPSPPPSSQTRPFVMVVSTRLLALSLFTSLAVATPLSSLYSRDLLVHESRDLLPTGFSLVGPAASQTPLKLRIALSQSNPDAIVAALLNVSDPSSGKYGKHLSKSEVSLAYEFRCCPWSLTGRRRPSHVYVIDMSILPMLHIHTQIGRGSCRAQLSERLRRQGLASRARPHRYFRLSGRGLASDRHRR